MYIVADIANLSEWAYVELQNNGSSAYYQWGLFYLLHTLVKLHVMQVIMLLYKSPLPPLLWTLPYFRAFFISVVHLYHVQCYVVDT